MGKTLLSEYIEKGERELLTGKGSDEEKTLVKGKETLEGIDPDKKAPVSIELLEE